MVLSKVDEAHQQVKDANRKWLAAGPMILDEGSGRCSVRMNSSLSQTYESPASKEQGTSALRS
jgi:hypothetical protein